jgi:two-component system, sensor histidine kinase PdtaS
MMKRLFFILILLMPSVLQAKVQGKALVDSLLKEIQGAKEDTKKVLLYARIASAYYSISPEDGLKYRKEELKLAESLGWKSGIAKAHNGLTNIYRLMNQYPAAIEHASIALKINEEIGDRRSMNVSLGNLASIYRDQGNLPKSLEYHFRVLKAAEEANDSHQVATTSQNISIVYFDLGDYNKDLEYCFRAMKKYEELNSRQDVAICLMNIASGYYGLNEVDKALDYDLKALALAEKLGDKVTAEVATGNIGEIYQGLKDYNKALEYDFRALKMSEELQDREGIASISAEIGHTYLETAKDTSGIKRKGEFASIAGTVNLHNAIQYLNKAKAYAEEIGSLQLLIKISSALAEAYKLDGNFKEAFENYKKFTVIKDSVFSNDNKIKIANLATKREEELKEKQIQINKLGEVKKRNERTMYIVGVGLLLIVIIFVDKNYKTQKQANKEKGELLRQKDVLMKEIHHRVKNNLQVIGALLDLQLNTITDEHAKDAMTESTTRVRSISLIHQQLYQNENLTTIEFSRFTKDLLHQVTSVFKAPGQHITLKKEIPETVLDIDTAVPLGLILNELMTNSYKYAFAGASEGSIEIVMQRKNGGYRLTYTDSGPGLPQGFNISSVKSMGLKVVHSLSKQIGGNFTYEPADKSFIVTFKDETGRKMIN